jgi:triosephosphate isomerase (TIM)
MLDDTINSSFVKEPRAMNNHFTYIANWKMNWSFQQTMAFAITHKNALISMSNTHTTIGLAASPLTLQSLAQLYNTTPIKIFAQDSAAQQPGAYTGDVAAAHLAAINCNGSLIGHSERRRYHHETNELVQAKMQQLLACNLLPVICIGETLEQRNKDETLVVLEQQLSNVFSCAAAQSEPTHNIIAYEPVWAIGTGLVPTIEQLIEVFSWLSKACASQPGTWTLLYGGSVTAANASTLKGIDQLGGFLIGGASLDFQEFEKIVKCQIVV